MQTAVHENRLPDRRRYERHLGVVLWIALFAVLVAVA